MEDIIRAIFQIREEIKEIKRQIEMLKKRPDVLFKEDWMDGQDVQLAMNISPGTLRSLRRSGRLPFAQINQKLYYKVADVKSLLQENYISTGRGGEEGERGRGGEGEKMLNFGRVENVENVENVERVGRVGRVENERERGREGERGRGGENVEC